MKLFSSNQLSVFFLTCFLCFSIVSFSQSTSKSVNPVKPIVDQTQPQTNKRANPVKPIMDPAQPRGDKSTNPVKPVMVGEQPPSDKSVNPVKPILPSIQFKSVNPVKPIFSKEQIAILDRIAETIKQNPEGRIKVSGQSTMTKTGQQASWEQVNGVIRYLVEKRGISPSRFIFNSNAEEGTPGTVDLAFTDENGPQMVPAPHPDLRTMP